MPLLAIAQDYRFGRNQRQLNARPPTCVRSRNPPIGAGLSSSTVRAILGVRKADLEMSLLQPAIDLEPAEIAPPQPRPLRAIGWVALGVSLMNAIPALSEAARTAWSVVESQAWQSWSLPVLLRQIFSPAFWAACWLICVSIALIRLGWRELWVAALLTFALATINCFARAGFAIMGQVDHEPMPGVSDRTLDRIDAGYHAVVGALALAVALATLVAARRSCPPRDGTRVSSSRPSAIVGRMAIVGALLFGGYVAFEQSWMVYEKIGLQSVALRKIMADRPEIRTRRASGNASPRTLAEMDLVEAYRLAATGNYRGARRAFVRGLKVLEELSAESKDSQRRVARRADAFNSLAWMLATCPVESERDAANAVRFAKRALELTPDDGNTWNTLGVAYYRLGDFAEARSGLYKSMSLRDGGDAHDWFFLAMIEHKTDHPADAARWFDKAVADERTRRARPDEFQQFCVEAARLLGRETAPKPAPTTLPADVFAKP